MDIEKVREICPEKLAPEATIFSHINPGSRIFIGTGCGEPQYLVKALIDFVESNPKTVFDTEVLHIWTLGIAPYTAEKFRHNFRHNAFFIGDNTRDAVNRGMADYAPVFLSEVPRLLRQKMIPIDVALVQVSPPDEHGFCSLGISVDVVKAAVENASLVIAQMNVSMPRVHGDSFVHLSEIDFIVHHDEPLLEYEAEVPSHIAEGIGKHVARIVEDGDTIQVGYGSVPNAILTALGQKKDLGVHTELFTQGIADLMKAGVVTNTRKRIDRGKTIAAFCMGKKQTYAFVNDNPRVEFRAIDYTNNPLAIAGIEHITAINGALEIDLTGQATAESIGRIFYSGVGGQADFMRGAALAPGGKTILVFQSTAHDESVSRIVPFLQEGAGATLTRGDVHYVVTEYGIAYLHGKNIRERAMSLIAIAHPKFRPALIAAAREHFLIYGDQAYLEGKGGQYPEDLESRRTAKSGDRILLRPVRISDEAILKDFFYSLSEATVYKRFMSARKAMPHEQLQRIFMAIDYTKEMVMLAVFEHKGREVIAGVAQYRGNENSHTAEVAVMVKDEYQNRGVGRELLSHITYVARRQGLLGFTAEVLKDNRAMLHLFEKMGFSIEKETLSHACTLRLGFREP